MHAHLHGSFRVASSQLRPEGLHRLGGVARGQVHLLPVLILEASLPRRRCLLRRHGLPHPLLGRRAGVLQLDLQLLRPPPHKGDHEQFWDPKSTDDSF